MRQGAFDEMRAAPHSADLVRQTTRKQDREADLTTEPRGKAR